MGANPKEYLAAIKAALHSGETLSDLIPATAYGIGDSQIPCGNPTTNRSDDRKLKPAQAICSIIGSSSLCALLNKDSADISIVTASSHARSIPQRALSTSCAGCQYPAAFERRTNPAPRLI